MATTPISTPGSKKNPHDKDPDALLDYSEDWTAFLIPVSDTIDTVEFIFDDPATTLVLDHSTHDGLIVTAWLSGGRVDETETCTVRIHTVQGRIDDRTMFFKMAPK